MHSTPEDTGPALTVVRSFWDGDLAAYPNTGANNDSGGWDWTDAQTPEAFADSCEQWVAQDARIVGGCCGYGPEHIRAMSARLAGVPCDAPSRGTTPTTARNTAEAVRRRRFQPCRGDPGARSIRTNDE